MPVPVLQTVLAGKKSSWVCAQSRANGGIFRGFSIFILPKWWTLGIHVERFPKFISFIAFSLFSFLRKPRRSSLSFRAFSAKEGGEVQAGRPQLLAEASCQSWDPIFLGDLGNPHEGEWGSRFAWKWISTPASGPGIAFADVPNPCVPFYRGKPSPSLEHCPSFQAGESPEQATKEHLGVFFLSGPRPPPEKKSGFPFGFPWKASNKVAPVRIFLSAWIPPGILQDPPNS